MLKIYNVCLTAAVVATCVSCSTLFSNRKSSMPVADSAADTLSIAAIDSLNTAADEAVEPMIPIETMADSLFILDPTTEGTEEDDHETFFFEGDDTSSTIIDEYRNMVVNDMTINLAEENNHYPVDGGHVTSNYGWRGRRMHAGIDLKAQRGDNIYAAFDGVVRLAKYHGAYGNCLIIRHYNGLETLYGHNTKLLVGVNDEVKAGDVIAYAGSTGRSTGPHLHFETRVAGHYFSPNLILDTKNHKLKDANLYITMRNGRLFASNNDSEEEREAYILQQISIRYYTVRSGDTLGAIAKRNGTTVTTICRLNGISSRSILRIGQRLIVRDGIKIPVKKETPKAENTTTTKAQSSTKQPAQQTATYVVRRGDTLGAIAKRNGTTVSKICSLNGISSRSTLRIGQRLKISGSATSAQHNNTAAAQYHTVKSGDTLGGIAVRYGTTVTKLCSLNGISRGSILNLKQKIRVK